MAKKTAGAPKRGWRQWTEHEARTAIEQFARSGLSQAKFARSKGFSTQRLVYWKTRLDQAARPAFVRVELPRAEASSAPRQVEIVAGAVVIRVREDLDVEQLARIVDALDRGQRRC